MVGFLSFFLSFTGTTIKIPLNSFNMLPVFAIKKGRSEYYSVIFNFQVYINKSTLSMISSLNEYRSLLLRVGASQKLPNEATPWISISAKFLKPYFAI